MMKSTCLAFLLLGPSSVLGMPQEAKPPKTPAAQTTKTAVQPSKKQPEVSAQELEVLKVCIAAEENTQKGAAKTPDDHIAPLSLVMCEVENALNAYQQSPDVDDETKKVLPKIASAELDFKTVADTKFTGGIGLFIVKILGGSYDKQKTNEVTFTYVPKSLLKTALEGGKAQSFQQELLDTIKNAARAVREQQEQMGTPAPGTDPLVFKQLALTVSFGVTKGVSFGVAVPISVVTLSAQLDKTKNNVQSVKLTFAPPPPKDKKPTDGGSGE